jgi:chemotaxis protein MotB
MSKKKGGHGGGGGGGHDGAGGMRWLLTYSDIVTLLLALFIYLFSISTIDVVKLRAFTQGMQILFGISNAGKIPKTTVNKGGEKNDLPESKALMKVKPTMAINRLDKELEGKFQKMAGAHLITVAKVKDGLTIRLRDRVLFEPGKATILPKAEPILNDIAYYIKDLHNLIRIDGHTDNVPVKPGSEYSSNWELSVGRALAVLRYLSDACNIAPERMSVAGYGQYKPYQPNDPVNGNPENRRVEITILEQ